jgi:hypothetical protein
LSQYRSTQSIAEVIIGRQKVSSFTLSCFISKFNLLLQAAVDSTFLSYHYAISPSQAHLIIQLHLTTTATTATLPLSASPMFPVSNNISATIRVRLAWLALTFPTETSISFAISMADPLDQPVPL